MVHMWLSEIATGVLFDHQSSLHSSTQNPFFIGQCSIHIEHCLIKKGYVASSNVVPVKGIFLYAAFDMSLHHHDYNFLTANLPPLLIPMHVMTICHVEIISIFILNTVLHTVQLLV